MNDKESIIDLAPKKCHKCGSDELIVLKVWGKRNYYQCNACKTIYNHRCQEITQSVKENSELSLN